MSNTESELKLRLADPACLQQLLDAPLLQRLASQPPSTQTLETTYYDTVEQHLLKSRLSYRLRLADKEWTATVKADGTSDGGLHQRTEYNTAVTDPIPSLAPFLDTAIGPRLAAAVGDQPLEPVFSTHFQRHILNITAPDGSTIELALDDGEIIAGDNHQPLLELELELKSGQPQALIWLGAALAEDFPLLPEQASKLYRAAVLAGLAASQDEELPVPLKKTSGVLPARQVLSQVLIYHLHAAIKAQQAYLAAPADPAAVRSFQLALHKICALWQLMKPLLPADEYAAWSSRLTIWCCKLDHVQELTAFCQHWDELSFTVTKLLSHQSSKSALTTLLADKCHSASAVLHTETAAGQCTPVLLGLWAFLAQNAGQADAEPQPCKKFVRERLTHWLACLFKRGDELDCHDPGAVHKLQLACLRLWYVLDALTPILPDNTQTLGKRLQQLQEQLGCLAAITVTPQLLQELVKASASRLTHQDAGLMIGWQLAQAAAAGESWDKNWSKIKKAAAKAKKLRPLEDTDSKRSPEL